MSEEINQVTARGGRVWTAPTTGTVSSVAKSLAKHEMYKTFAQVISIVMFLPTVVVLCIGYNSINNMREKSDMRQSFVEEYGYTRVVMDEEKFSAEVVTLDGDEKKVDSINYNGAIILYENQEQLDEKITEVDSGTYPEELYR